MPRQITGDDSAGPYGTWNDDDLSWLDFIKAKGSDIGGGAYNALANLSGALSPIGTSEQGNMALQVPPMVSGIADSYARLAGTPSNPGSAYDLSGIPELDAPIQQDMSNVLLSLYGGNAVAGLAKGRNVAASPEKTRPNINLQFDKGQWGPQATAYLDGQEAGRFVYDELPNAVVVKDAMVEPDFQRRGVASEVYGQLQDHFQKPMTPDTILTPDGYKFWKSSYPDALRNHEFGGNTWIDTSSGGHGNAAEAMARLQKNGVPEWRMSGGPNRPDDVLWSDTGRPSILGSALATGGEQPRSSLGAGAMREAEGTRGNALAWHRPEDSQTPMQQQGVHQGDDLSGRMPDLSQGQPAPAPRSLIENDLYLKAWADHLGLDYDGSLSPIIANQAALDYLAPKYLGVRMTPYPMKVGEIAPESTTWYQDFIADDHPTFGREAFPNHGELLGGSSTVALPLTRDGIAKAREQYAGYSNEGDYVSIVGGDRAWHGDDVNERVIKDARVLGSSKYVPGETLFSDNRPSIFGSALATGGEQQDIPDWLRF